MQFLKDLYDKYKVGSVDFGNDYTQSFGNGQTAMIYAWGHMEGTMKEKYPDIDYGVFATRAPFRPNPIGLSAVRLERVELHPLDGPVLHLSGVDLVDGTPILDIKPYVPLADCIPEASEGFTAVPYERLDVEIPESFGGSMSPEERSALEDTLSLDPRPQYQDDPERVYGLLFSGWEVKFRVEGSRLLVLALHEIKAG